MEYQRYSGVSSGIMRRESEAEEWAECPLDDVPREFFDEETRAAGRRLGLRDVPDDVPEGGAFVGAKSGPQTTMVAIRHANPAVDAIADELGLTGDELRARLNGAPGGTNKRVDEARFDAIARELGVDPEDARARFRD